MGVLADPAKRKGNMYDAEIIDRRAWSEHAHWFRMRLIDSPAGAPDGPFTFIPGQWLYLIDSHGFRADQRAFSLGTSPADLPELELAVEIVPGGLFSPRVPTWQVGDRFTLRGPFGTFQLRESEAAWLGGALNSGVVPLVSMLRDRLEVAADMERRYELLFAYSSPDHCMYGETLEALAASHQNFTYRPVVTGSTDPAALPGSFGQGLMGAAASGNPQVYLAGLGGFIDTASAVVLGAGVPKERLMVERYD
ncbi:MAG TPA: FAD-dependent oxidoreductase [bacterium]|nr:FAD-dependent oxidoreductase [bacterium]